jgi:hypothetical protein
MTKVICGFPGIGKTTLSSNSNLDLDSSNYSWHLLFPTNYLEVIKANLGKVDYIFVSTHDVVLQALTKAGIDYTVVYPDRSLKEEYLARYKDRGSVPNFLEFMDMKWDAFIDDIESDPGRKVKLESGQYLNDVYKSIESANNKPSQKDLIIEALEQRLEDFHSNRAAGVSMHQVCMNPNLLEDVIAALKGDIK